MRTWLAGYETAGDADHAWLARVFLADTLIFALAWSALLQAPRAIRAHLEAHGWRAQ